MMFYKVIKNEEVIDASAMPIKWDEKHKCLMMCDADDIEFAQSYHTETLYYDSWMKRCQAQVSYELATVISIDKTEYDEIIALLDNGENIHVEEAQSAEPQLEQEEQVEQPMSINEMRQKITEQQAQIVQLQEQIQQILSK